MKLLHLPNERDPLDDRLRQVGSRKAFAKMAYEGRLREVRTFSYLHETKSLGADGARRRILDEVEAFQPDAIFWQHVGEFPVHPPFAAELRARAPGALLVYHEADPYDRWVKRVNASMKVLLAACDLVLAVGLGGLSSLFREAGARDVRYLPHCYDNIRFGQPWTPPLERPFEAVMIANRGRRRRAPMLYLPGGRRRAAFATGLSKALGSRFALYGSGWEGLESARGRLSFDKQGEAIRSAWLSVNWDHFDDIPFYFSDRLPISLAAGVVHVTSHHLGYEQILQGCPGLYWARDVGEGVAMVEWLLSRPRELLAEEGSAAQAWAAANLEADVVFAQAIALCQDALARKRSQ